MSAIISECELFRYRLERELNARGQIGAFIMVNPSIADATTDDNTIRFVKGIGETLGWRRVLVGNKFAFRATNINDLPKASDPIGPDNDRHLEQIMRDADVHVVAWGNLDKLPKPLRNRWQQIVRIADKVGCTLHCLGVNNDRHPKHPLRIPYKTPLVAWPVPYFIDRKSNDQ